MLGSVRALLEGIIDYAGLFPPAKLDLSQALRNYTDYLSGADAWMLGRFICPVRRTGDVNHLLLDADPTLPGKSLRFSLLSSGSPSLEVLIDSLREDTRILANSGLSRLAQVGDVWEVRLPSDVFGEGNADALSNLLEAVDAVLGEHGARSIFYEVPMREVENIHNVTRVMALQNNPGRHTRVGFKMRTGGLEPAAVPAPDQVAQVLVACRESRLPVKFTAGLHHSVRRFDEQVGTYVFGFLNVFGAAMLSHTQESDAAKLGPVLVEEDPTHFVFTDSEFGWKDYRIEIAVVKELRKHNVLSFGSCSFDEPRDDLLALGLLAPSM
jgi:hypothetical protein